MTKLFIDKPNLINLQIRIKMISGNFLIEIKVFQQNRKTKKNTVIFI